MNFRNREACPIVVLMENYFIHEHKGLSEPILLLFIHQLEKLSIY